jgi:hypothetical protein
MSDQKMDFAKRSQKYVLKESILDSSSSEDEEKTTKRSKKRRHSSSILSNSSSASSPIRKSSVSFHPSTETFDEEKTNKDSSSVGVVDISQDTNSDLLLEPYGSNLTGGIAMSRIEQPDKEEEELIPLRNRANSDLQNYKSFAEKLAANSATSSSTTPNLVFPSSFSSVSSSSSSSSSTAIERETPERWRNRLWPGKAIIAYVRIITRCKPPPGIRPNEKLSFNRENVLRAHWRENEMNKVGIYFDSVMAHSAAFFLLTVEESRAAVTNTDDYDPGFQINPVIDLAEKQSSSTAAAAVAIKPPSSSASSSSSSASAAPLFVPVPPSSSANSSSIPRSSITTTFPLPPPPPPPPSSSSFNPNHEIGTNGWLDCEIMGIVGESEFGLLPQACDPRLGSVWIVNVAIKTPNISLNETTILSPSSKLKSISTSQPAPSSSSSSSWFGGNNDRSSLQKDSSLSGGDLVILSSPHSWNHHLLGIVSPWDPDFDLKFGVNFNINSQSSASSHAKYMDTFYNDKENNELTTANILICVDSSDNASNHVNFDIGGWASQGTIYPGVTFHMAIIGNVMTYIRECQALMSVKLLHPTLRDAILKPSLQIPLSLPTTIPSTSSSSASSSSSIVDPSDSEKGPSNIPSKLWTSLTKEYNESQLRAIRNVCIRGTLDEKQHNPSSSICLLQGPPGKSAL